MAEAMAEAGSPNQLSNDDLVENVLILVQQLFSDGLISDQERDYLKGNYSRTFSKVLD